MQYFFIMTRILVMRKDLNLKPKTQIARLLLNSAIVLAIFRNPELMESICGPFTIPIADKLHLIPYIMGLQILRIFYKPLTTALSKLPVFNFLPSYFSDLLIVKYIMVLIFKFFLIFQQQHRKKFYLHSFLLEGIILLMAVLFDCIQKDNIKEAGELLILEGLHRLSLIYELTQTFCPNLILYYAVSNLLIFVMEQVQAQQRYGLKHSLYVKHDVYRFMFMTCLFFALSGVAQLTSSNFKTLLTFLGCLKFLATALKAYNDSKLTQTINQLLLSGIVMAGCELLFIFAPFRFDGSVGEEEV